MNSDIKLAVGDLVCGASTKYSGETALGLIYKIDGNYVFINWLDDDLLIKTYMSRAIDYYCDYLEWEKILKL